MDENLKSCSARHSCASPEGGGQEMEVEAVNLAGNAAGQSSALKLQKNGCNSGQQHGAEAPFVRGAEAVFSAEINFVLRRKPFGFQREGECFGFFDAG